MNLKKINFSEICIIFVMLFLSWNNFQLFGLYFFIIFQTVLCVISFFRAKRKICFDKKDIVIWLMLILSLISAFFVILSDMPDSYKIYSLIMTIVLIPSYLSYAYLKKEFKRNNTKFQICIKYLKIGFLVQIIIVPIQFILYKIGIDINDLFFNKLLHLMENPTFFRQGTYHPSGFTWHSAMLAPLFVLAYLLFEKKMWVKILILLDAYLCGNNTALIGVLLTIILVSIHRVAFSSRIYKTSRKRIFSFVLIILAFILICILNRNITNSIIEKCNYLWIRIFEGSKDSSSAAHFSYYILYPEVLIRNTFLQSIFGTGYASSGYSISQISGQYASLKHWVTESDFIDILISRGLLGFIIYYIFLIQIAIRGKNVDYRYTVAMIVILLQGITYNVQFEYLFFIELILYACVDLKLNVFEANSFNKVEYRINNVERRIVNEE